MNHNNLAYSEVVHALFLDLTINPTSSVLMDSIMQSNETTRRPSISTISAEAESMVAGCQRRGGTECGEGVEIKGQSRSSRDLPLLS
jgi:hypothetical protein